MITQSCMGEWCIESDHHHPETPLNMVSCGSDCSYEPLLLYYRCYDNVQRSVGTPPVHSLPSLEITPRTQEHAAVDDMWQLVYYNGTKSRLGFVKVRMN